MRRREFIALVSTAAAMLPNAVKAQQAGGFKRVGALMGVAEDNSEGRAWISAFRRALHDLGWIEGNNVQVDVRWPAADIGRMNADAQELVEKRCDVILTHATPATTALRRATRTIPNVFAVVVDPVSPGFVESLARPGGNSTGFTNYEPSVGGKWLELLKEIAPGLSRVAILLNPDTSPGGVHSELVRSTELAAAGKGLATVVSPFRNPGELERGFDGFHRDKIDGVITMPDTSTTRYSSLIVELVARARMPAMYPYRDFVSTGGLLSYGVDRADLYRRAASYVDRILKGERPGDLPVQGPSKFELIINVKTAKALGLEIPSRLLFTADDVIE